MGESELFDDEFLARLQRLGLIAKRIPAVAASSGLRRGRRLGDGLEFADHREYAPGDDIRFLDWNYYARMERLLLRLFHEHSEGAVTILLDRSASMAVGEVRKFDYARRTAAALAYIAMSSLDRVNILPFAEELGEGLHTGRNRGQILEVLEYLEGLAAGGRTRLGPAVEQFVHRHNQTGTVLLLTDMMDAEEDLSDSLAMLRQRKDDVILLHVMDRSEVAPAVLGPMQLASAETPDRLAVDVTEEVLAGYRERWREWVAGLEKVCLSRGAVYVPAPTWSPFDRLVLEALQKAGVLEG